MKVRVSDTASVVRMQTVLRAVSDTAFSAAPGDTPKAVSL